MNRDIKIKCRRDLAKRIDDTRLIFEQGEDPEESVRELCDNALIEDFRAVCVRPHHVKLAKSILKGYPIQVAAVIGFPDSKSPLEQEKQDPTFGDIPLKIKVSEMEKAKADGADEFDAVMNIRLFKSQFSSGYPLKSYSETAILVKRSLGVTIKLIIETDLLTADQIVRASEVAIYGGVFSVKTSTGMLIGGHGATVRDVMSIYTAIQESTSLHKPKIKASGGIKTAQQAYDLLQAGADILGCSTGSQILNDFDLNKNKLL